MVFIRPLRSIAVSVSCAVMFFVADIYIHSYMRLRVGFNVPFPTALAPWTPHGFLFKRRASLSLSNLY